jgi:hypothetical protein
VLGKEGEGPRAVRLQRRAEGGLTGWVGESRGTGTGQGGGSLSNYFVLVFLFSVYKGERI